MERSNQILDIGTYVGDDLHLHPINPKEMFLYVQEEVVAAQAEDFDNLKYSRLSRVAVLLGVLKDYEQAHNIFLVCQKYFNGENRKMALVNYIRWADIFRFEKVFNQASEKLANALKIIEDDGFEEYRDFYMQHMGKLYYDQGSYSKARSFFEQCLEIRRTKNDESLIESTQLALNKISEIENKNI